jgi:hypothetical protein
LWNFIVFGVFFVFWCGWLLEDGGCFSVKSAYGILAKDLIVVDRLRLKRGGGGSFSLYLA